MATTLDFTLSPLGTTDYYKELYETSNSNISPWVPTNIYVREGQVIRFDVENADHLYMISSNRGQGASQYAELHNGINEIEIQYSGILFFTNESTGNEAHVKLIGPDNMDVVPTYDMNTSTMESFQAEYDANPDVPYVQLQGDRAFVILLRESMPFLDEPQRSIEYIENMLKLEDDLSGYSKGDQFGNADIVPEGYTYLIENNGGYMSAQPGFMYFHGDGALQRLLSPWDIDGTMGGLWGPAHELGHQHQSSLMGVHGEVTPNIYANWVRINYGLNFNNFGAESDPNQIYAAKPDAVYESLNEFGEWLGMYSQLTYAFGEGFWQYMHHDYRLIDTEVSREVSAGGAQAKMSKFAYYAMKNSGYDLTEFFEDWRITILPEDQALIDELELDALPPEAEEFWTVPLHEVYLDDLLNLGDYPPRDLPHATVKSDLIVGNGTTINPEDLISYDPAVVAKIELQDPDFVNTSITQGRIFVEVRLTGVNGEENVVGASVYVAPAELGPNPTAESIYELVLEYSESEEFLSGDFSQYGYYRSMLNRIDYPNTAELIEKLDSQVPGEGMYDTTKTWLWTMDNSDTYYDPVTGDLGLIMNESAYQRIQSIGAYIDFRVYDETGHYRGRFADGQSGSVVKSKVVDDQRIFYIQGGAINPEYDYEFTAYLKNDSNATLDSNHVITNIQTAGNPEPLTIEDIQNGFKEEFVYGDEKNVILRIDRDIWERMHEEGTFRLSIIQNGQEIAYADNNGLSKLYSAQSDDFFYIRRWSDYYSPEDKFEYKLDYTSNSADTSGNGSMSIEMLGSSIFGYGDMEVSSANAYAGDNLDNVIVTGDEPSLVKTLAGDDNITGGSGDDYIDAGAGNDQVFGGDGDDVIFGDGIGLINTDFSFDNHNSFGERTINQIDSVPGWNVETGTDVGVYTVNNGEQTTLMLDGNSHTAADGGYASVSQSTGLQYDADSKYQFKVNVLGRGTDMDSSDLTLRLYTIDASGNKTVVGEATNTISDDPAVAGNVYNYEVTSSGVSAEGELFVEIYYSATTAYSGPIEIIDSYFDHPYSDIILANGGDDVIYGGDGNDVIFGGAGFPGSAASDTIYGGAGDDEIILRGDGSTAFGEAGSDRFYIDPHGNEEPANYRIDGGFDGTDYDVLHLEGYRIANLDRALDEDGNSYSGSLDAIRPDGTVDNIVFNEIERIQLAWCFVSGTKIETKEGYTHVENLKSGDWVRTKDHGFQPIRWIGSQKISHDTLKHKPKLKPIRIAQGALGHNQPSEDLYVSRQHRVLLATKLALRVFGEEEILVAAKDLLAIAGVESVEECDSVEYYHIMFDEHEVIYSNGAETESLLVTASTVHELSDEARDEIFEIFPDLADDEHFMMPARTIVVGKQAKKLAKRY